MPWVLLSVRAVYVLSSLNLPCHAFEFFCGALNYKGAAGDAQTFCSPVDSLNQIGGNAYHGRFLARMTPQELQKVLDELQASRASRKRPGENLQELRWVLQDSAAMKLPPPARKTIDLEGKQKDGVRKAIRDRQNALHELVNAINQYRKLSESKPLTLQGSDYAHAMLELNKAIDHAERLLLQ